MSHNKSVNTASLHYTISLHTYKNQEEQPDPVFNNDNEEILKLSLQLILNLRILMVNGLYIT